MKKKPSVLAVILARGGSKGIKKKNIKKIANHPLISYSIYAATKSAYVDKVIVSSDSKEIREISKKYGAEAPFVRPKELSGDKVPSVTALKHAVLKSENFFKKKFDYIVELPCVSPLRDSTDIDKSLHILIKNKYDSVISYVNTGEKHPTRLKRIKKNKVVNFCKDYPEPDIGSRRQDFEPCFIRNGAIYAMSRNTLIKKNSRNGKRSFPFIMSDNKSINIDAMFDFKIAELLIKDGECKNYPATLLKYSNNFKYTSKRKNILVTSPMHFLDDSKKKLEKRYNVKYAYNFNKKYIQKNINNFDAWICHPSPKYKIDSQILKNAKKLEIIASPSTGTNHIDINYCNKKKILVKSIRHSNALKNIKASSEFTFSLLIAAFKNLHKGILAGKSGNWRENEEFLRGNQLDKKVLGIIGYGRIGSNLAKYCNSFGMKIYAYDPYKKIKTNYVQQLNSLPSMLKKCDAICICIHLSKKTFKFINKDKLDNMKDKSILINTSRGEIIDENYLTKVIKNKKLKFFATDVVSNENNLPIKKSKIFNVSQFENVYITPHMAGLTYESENIASQITIDNVNKYFKLK